MRIARWLLLAVLAAPAYGQDGGPLHLPKPLAATVEAAEDFRVSRLIGMWVVDASGEMRGRIEDVLLDRELAGPHFVVVESGGFLDLGDRERLQPLRRIAPAGGLDSVRLEGGLPPPPGLEFDPRRWVSARALLGQPVVDDDGARAGELEDVVVNVGSGSVRYAVLESVAHGAPLAMPFDTLALPRDEGAPVRLRGDPLLLLGALPALLETAAAGASALRLGAQELIGRPVFNRSGERLGELGEVVFHSQTGRVRYVTVDAGLLEPPAAFSTGQLRLREDGALVIGVAEETLEHVPAREGVAWPAMRASALLGREVVDRLRRDAGEIVDLSVDLAAGRVSHAWIELRDDWRPGSTVRRVPIDALSLPRDLGDRAALNLSLDRLRREAR